MMATASGMEQVLGSTTQMRRPGELVDGQETLQAEAAVDQEPRIAGEAARIAGDIDREIETRGLISRPSLVLP